MAPVAVGVGDRLVHARVEAAARAVDLRVAFYPSGIYATILLLRLRAALRLGLTSARPFEPPELQAPAGLGERARELRAGEPRGGRLPRRDGAGRVRVGCDLRQEAGRQRQADERAHSSVAHARGGISRGTRGFPASAPRKLARLPPRLSGSAEHLSASVCLRYHLVVRVVSGGFFLEILLERA